MAFSAETQSLALVSIYEAALDPSQWPTALDAIAHALGGSGASVVSVRGNGTIDMRASTSPVDATSRDLYNRHYGRLDDVMARMCGSRSGPSLGCYDLVDRDEFLRSEFYDDWLREIDLGDGLFLVLQ